MTTEAPPFKEAMQREDVGMEVHQIEGGGGNNDNEIRDDYTYLRRPVESTSHSIFNGNSDISVYACMYFYYYYY